MKTTKDGKIRLSAVDFRVGNYIFSNYEQTVAFQDISSTIVLKISKRTQVGMLVAEAINQKDGTFLSNYAAMAYYVNGVVPDVEFWKQMSDAIESCIKRHPELYGQAKETDDEADAEIIREEEEDYSALRDMKREISSDGLAS